MIFVLGSLVFWGHTWLQRKDAKTQILNSKVGATFVAMRERHDELFNFRFWANIDETLSTFWFLNGARTVGNTRITWLARKVAKTLVLHSKIRAACIATRQQQENNMIRCSIFDFGRILMKHHPHIEFAIFSMHGNARVMWSARKVTNPLVLHSKIGVACRATRERHATLFIFWFWASIDETPSTFWFYGFYNARITLLTSSATFLMRAWAIALQQLLKWGLLRIRNAVLFQSRHSTCTKIEIWRTNSFDNTVTTTTTTTFRVRQPPGLLPQPNPQFSHPRLSVDKIATTLPKRSTKIGRQNIFRSIHNISTYLPCWCHFVHSSNKIDAFLEFANFSCRNHCPSINPCVLPLCLPDQPIKSDTPHGILSRRSCFITKLGSFQASRSIIVDVSHSRQCSWQSPIQPQGLGSW